MSGCVLQDGTHSKRPIHYHPMALAEATTSKRPPLAAWSDSPGKHRPTSALSSGGSDSGAGGAWRESRIAQAAGAAGVSRSAGTFRKKKPELVRAGSLCDPMCFLSQIGRLWSGSCWVYARVWSSLVRFGCYTVVDARAWPVDVEGASRSAHAEAQEHVWNVQR